MADAMIRAPKQCGPATPAGELRHLFRDDHVHAALIVEDSTLITVVERADLDDMASSDGSIPDHVLAARLGRLRDRTVLENAPLWPVHRQMIETNQRRLAVVDHSGHLAGLLCLKRSGDGFCSDEDVENRARGAANVTVIPAVDRITGSGPAPGTPSDCDLLAEDVDLVAVLERWHRFGGPGMSRAASLTGSPSRSAGATAAKNSNDSPQLTRG